MLDALLRPASWADKLASLRTRRASAEAELARIDAERKPLLVDAAMGDREADTALSKLDDAHRQMRRSRDTLAQAEREAQDGLAAELAAAAAAERARKVKALDKLHRERIDAVGDLALAMREMFAALRKTVETGEQIAIAHREITGSRRAVDNELSNAALLLRLQRYAVALNPAIAGTFGWHGPYSDPLNDLVAAERALQEAFKP